MENKETKQPTHTQGEWKFVHTNIHPEEKNEFHSVIQLPKFAISLINTNIISKEETEANTRRIVKCVNMHDELVKALKECFVFVQSKTAKDIRKMEQNMYLLLKQAELE